MTRPCSYDGDTNGHTKTGYVTRASLLRFPEKISDMPHQRKLRLSRLLSHSPQLGESS